MNRCEEVLKHSINKGLKIEKDELYHSDTYLGSEYDEGLKHWKYIKKYKNSKGKTVYVYANKETHYKIKAYKNMSDEQKNSQKKVKSKPGNIWEKQKRAFVNEDLKNQNIIIKYPTKITPAANSS